VLDTDAWLSATGTGSVTVKQLPLWPLGLILPKSVGVEDLTGNIDATLQLERADPRSLPHLFLQAHTNALSFRRKAAAGSDASPTTFDGFAVHTSASIDGHSGHGVATVLLADEQGKLLTTTASLKLALPSLLANPRSLLSELLTTPLDALVRLHPRALSLLPAPFGARDLAGSVEATLQVGGTLAEPRLALVARGNQLLGSVGGSGRAVDITSIVHYAPNTGGVTGVGRVVQGGKNLVSARLEGTLPNPLSATAAGPLQLSAAAMLNGVPLDLWPAAARERVQARLYGSIDLEHGPNGERQRAHLEIGELTAHGHPLGNGRAAHRRGPALSAGRDAERAGGGRCSRCGRRGYPDGA
jgi:hypothetical protein